MEPNWTSPINTNTYDNVVPVGPVTVTVPSKGSQATGVTFYDLTGNVVTSANLQAGSATVPGPSGTWKPGWYHMVATGPLNDPTVGNKYGNSFLGVWRNLGNLPNPISLPAEDAQPLGGGNDSGLGNDLYLHGWTAMGPVRYILNDPADLNSSDYSPNLADIKYMINFEQNGGTYLNPTYADSARPRVPLVAFSHYSQAFAWLGANLNSGSTYTSITVEPIEMAYSSGDQMQIINDNKTQVITLSASAAVGATTLSVNSFTANNTFYQTCLIINKTKYCGGITQAVSELSAAPYNVRYFEGINEPRGEKSMNEWVTAHYYNLFRIAVKAGNANAKALGPAEVSYMQDGADYGGAPNMTDLARFLSTITPGTLDVFSGHFYNCYLDPLAWARTLSSARTTLNNAGYTGIELWVTEGPSILSNGWNLIDINRQVQAELWFYLVAEQYGVTKERCAIFYDSSHGFNDYRSWIKEYGSLYPIVTGLRVRSEEVFGKAFEAALNFGTLGTGFFFGNVLRGSGGTCVEIITQGNIYDEVTLNVSDTGTITYSDWQGQTSTTTVSGGKITIPVSSLPTYIRLSAGCTVSVTSSLSRIVGGTNVATTATAVSGTGAANVSKIKDGIFQTGGQDGNFDTSGEAFRDNSAIGANSYVELQWGSAQTIASIAWRGLPAWQDNSAAIVRAKLEYWDGSVWRPCPTLPLGHWDKNGGYKNLTAANSYALWNPEAAGFNTLNGRWSAWDYQWSYSAPFSVPVSTTKVRMTVLDTTHGHAADPIAGAGIGTQMFIISELCAFSATALSTTGPGGGSPKSQRIVIGG